MTGTWLARCAVASLAAAAAVLGLTGIAPVARAATVTSPQRAGIAELMASYANNFIGGSWGWQAAVGQSTVESYQQATGDVSYYGDIAATYAKYNGDDPAGKPDFENYYMDDTGWWGLAWLQAYQMTGDTAYLRTAEADAAYIHGYWDSTCGGGVWWSIAKTYKNAIANELFLELTAWLHIDVPGDTTYLGWADAEWAWFSASGMINSSNLVNDGLTISSTGACTSNGGTTWTYNQGVILAGLAQLSRATGNATLLTRAEGIAGAAISHLAPAGVLTEPCAAAGCDGNQQTFKGIFVRDLAVLAATAGTSQYDSFITEQAASIEATDTYPGSTFGLLWAGPAQSTCISTSANPCDTGTQASAEQALVAALGGPTARPAAVISAQGAVSVFARGTGGSIQADSLPSNTAAWSGWASLGGAFPGDPAALAAQGGATWVFAIGANGALAADTRPAGATAWSGWTGLAGPGIHLTGTPAVVQDHSGAIRVFARAANGDLYQDVRASTAWSGFTSLGGIWPYDVTALVGAGGFVHVFAVGLTISLYHDQLSPVTGSAWSGWANLGGSVAGVPAAVQDTGGVMRVFVRDTGGAALEQYAAGVGSTAYSLSSRGGTWPYDAAALAAAGGSVDLFAVGDIPAVYLQEMSAAGAWSAWTGLGGTFTGVPAAVQAGDGTIRLFGRQSTGALGEDVLPGGTGTWTGWTSLGGSLS